MQWKWIVLGAALAVVAVTELKAEDADADYLEDQKRFHPKDWGEVQRLKPLLALENQVAKEWLKKFQSEPDLEQRNLAYGAHHTEARVGVEEVTFRALLVEREGRIVQLRLEVWGPFHENRLALLRKAWGSNVTRAQGGMVFTWRNAGRLATWKAAIAKDLGSVVESNPADRKLPKAVADAWALLMDPTQDYEFGVSCYESGEAPPGYLAIQELVKAKRHDMVRAVLRSPNPQARMHAALVLLEAQKKRGKKDKKNDVEPLDDKDQAAIKKLRAQAIKILCCDGSLISHKKPAVALDDYLSDD